MKKSTIFILVILLILGLVGWNFIHEVSESGVGRSFRFTPPQESEEVVEPEESPESEENPEPEETPEAEETLEPEQIPEQEQPSEPEAPPLAATTLTDLEINFPIEFKMSSGAGGWWSTVTLQADGSFNGYYQDTDASGFDEGPMWMTYSATSTGSFAFIEQTNEFEYLLIVEASATEELPGTSRTEENTQYEFVDTQFTEGSRWRLLAPGTPISSISARDWDLIRGWSGGSLYEVTEELPYWVLFREDGGASFIAP